MHASPRGISYMLGNRYLVGDTGLCLVPDFDGLRMTIPRETQLLPLPSPTPNTDHHATPEESPGEQGTEEACSPVLLALSFAIARVN